MNRTAKLRLFPHIFHFSVLFFTPVFGTNRSEGRVFSPPAILMICDDPQSYTNHLNTTQSRRARRGVFSYPMFAPAETRHNGARAQSFFLTVHFLSRMGICMSLRSRAVTARLCVRKTTSWQNTSLRTLRLCVVFKRWVVRLWIIIYFYTMNAILLCHSWCKNIAFMVYIHAIYGIKTSHPWYKLGYGAEPSRLLRGRNSKYH